MFAGVVATSVVALTTGPVTTARPAAADVVRSVTFAFTGGPQQFLVPAGVSEVTVQAWGARGGRGQSTVFSDPPMDDLTNLVTTAQPPGGLGGYTAGTVKVSAPGQILQVNVGGAGGDGYASSQYDQLPLSAGSGAAGYNGGGAGSSVLDLNNVDGAFCAAAGGGGGGASDVRTGAFTLADRVVVAGGGGGSAGYGRRVGGTGGEMLAHVGTGGDGGGQIGSDGAPDPTSDAKVWSGTGGTPLSGGVWSGTLGNGGAATVRYDLGGECDAEAEGGGGGGLYGGGAGFGGGGGSSTYSGYPISGSSPGNGQVIISWIEGQGAPPPGSEAPGGETPMDGGSSPSGVPAILPPEPRFTG